MTDGTQAVCQPLEEKDTACERARDCPAPLACAGDYRCRNLCEEDDDCNVLGVTGRVCAVDTRGTLYCADPKETENGNLIAEPLRGANIDDDMDGSANAGRDAGSDAAPSPEGGTDGGGGCSRGCGINEECVDGECTACGARNQSCCGDFCSTNLSCVEDTCRCGGVGQACCNGNSCNAGVTCVGGKCACGGEGQACCPGPAEEACGTSLVCAGTRCGCIAEITDVLVRRVDNRVFSNAIPFEMSGATPFALLDGNGDPLVVDSIASAHHSEGFGCAVPSDGHVWCWSYAGTNSAGQLGWGTSDVSGAPVQVVTAIVGGTPLSGMKRVFVSANTTTACATNEAGALWCWGDGQSGKLGNGTTNNSLFAVPVLTSAGGPQLTGISKVAIDSQHVCALKTDGTVWCWGYNGYGQIGAGTIDGTVVSFPAQVSSVFNRARDISVASASSCALLDDSRAYCWGASFGLGRGPSAPNTLDAAPVLLSDLTTPLSGVASLVAGGACALLSADRSLWCWNNSATFTAQAQSNGSVLLSGLYTAASSSHYVTAEGQLFRSGQMQTSIPCR